MLRNILSILATFILTSCNYSNDKTSSTKERAELVPKQLVDKSVCTISNPDTSLSKLRLRDSESVRFIMSTNDKSDDNGQYQYYSKMAKEKLTMIQHPGDVKYQISIFRIEYSANATHDYRKLDIDTFVTEKGVKLGLNKKQIIERLGSCYVSKDSSKNYIELYYRIETPRDSRTKILANNNMPIYYASYKLWDDKLKIFEFGFDYP